jgi:hypothetical protein
VSNTDSFIEEVNEEVRRDRLYGYLRRYGWIGVVLVLAIVGGAAWNEWRKAQERALAQGFGDALVAVLDGSETGTRVSQIAAIAAQGEQRAIVQLLLAAETAAAGDQAGALRILAALAGDTTVAQHYRSLAALKRVMIGGAVIPAAEREQVLAGLIANSPFRPLALEQQALLRIETGNTAGAAAILRDLRRDAEATDALRRRAAQILAALGETVESA